MSGLLTFFLVIIFTFSALYSQPNYFTSLRTDKSRYNPGDVVNFEISLNNPPPGSHLKINYEHLFKTVSSDSIFNLQQTNWSWLPPQNDFTGYLVEVFIVEGSAILDQINTAVDVSSDYSKFPRYGFLSKYPLMTEQQMNDVISNLNDHHINAIQFYDWHYKHHVPLSGTPQNPSPSWSDIANRTNYFSTINRYIELAHDRNMKAMSYNLLYGALENAGQDGVANEWYLYKDNNHTQKDFLDHSFWGHYIYLLDPGNSNWQNYIYGQMQNAFTALPFDGWHVDQVGDRGTLYDYSGTSVNLRNCFTDFLTNAKNFLHVNMVMNAVNQYGQQNIAQSPVDFLYTEVWSPNTIFNSLAAIIVNNSNLSGGTKNSVLAAYVNHDLSGNPGYFNTPAVLYADAVIYAYGGSHIELGEHMLGHEYFPNENLSMTDELKTSLKNYYNFLTAYENLLRDKGILTTADLLTSGSTAISKWPPVLGTITSFKKQIDSLDVFHLINFKGATTLDWRDNSKTQHEPDLLENIPLSFTTSRSIDRIWFASPDYNLSSPVEIQFQNINNDISFTLPYLKYWDMVVVEYKTSTDIEQSYNEIPTELILNQNYPNPFNPSTTIEYTIPTSPSVPPLTKGRDMGGVVTLKVYDILGKEIATLVDEYKLPGKYEVKFDASHSEPSRGIPSGVYFYRLQAGNYSNTKKLIIMK